jgi:hypothetical protein
VLIAPLSIQIRRVGVQKKFDARLAGGFIALAAPVPGIYLTAWPAGVIYVTQLIAFIASALALSLPVIRFHIVPKRRMWGRAHAEAMRQFLAQGIHLTKHRTGVLIFASAAERYAEIVADSAIGQAPEARDMARRANLGGNHKVAGLPDLLRVQNAWDECQSP